MNALEVVEIIVTDERGVEELFITIFREATFGFENRVAVANIQLVLTYARVGIAIGVLHVISLASFCIRRCVFRGVLWWWFCRARSRRVLACRARQVACLLVQSWRRLRGCVRWLRWGRHRCEWGRGCSWSRRRGVTSCG